MSGWPYTEDPVSEPFSPHDIPGLSAVDFPVLSLTDERQLRRRGVPALHGPIRPGFPEVDHRQIGPPTCLHYALTSRSSLTSRD